MTFWHQFHDHVALTRPHSFSWTYHGSHHYRSYDQSMKRYAIASTVINQRFREINRFVSTGFEISTRLHACGARLHVSYTCHSKMVERFGRQLQWRVSFPVLHFKTIYLFFPKSRLDGTAIHALPECVEVGAVMTHESRASDCTALTVMTVKHGEKQSLYICYWAGFIDILK